MTDLPSQSGSCSLQTWLWQNLPRRLDGSTEASVSISSNNKKTREGGRQKEEGKKRLQKWNKTRECLGCLYTRVPWKVTYCIQRHGNRLTWVARARHHGVAFKHLLWIEEGKWLFDIWACDLLGFLFTLFVFFLSLAMYGGAPVQENITVLGGRHDGARIYTPRYAVM